jgi:hypothetical protein
MGNGLKENKKILYNLTKRFGKRIDVKQVIGRTRDTRTGKYTTTYTTLKIRKAVILPVIEARSFSYHLAYIAANRNFTYGGLFDDRRRSVFVYKKDIPKDVEIKLDDRVVVNGEHFDVKDLLRLDDYSGILLTIENVGTVTDA